MHKQYLLTILLLLVAYCNSNAQSKHDNVWLFSRSKVPPFTTEYGASRMDFSTNPVSISSLTLPFELLGGTGICDSAGNLLFFTNGCYILNANGEFMSNGTINMGVIHASTCNFQGSNYYPAFQLTTAIPDPAGPNKYILIHYPYNDDRSNYTDLFGTFITHTPETGSVQIEQANVRLNPSSKDTLAPQLSAVKHGNGRDWWILVPGLFSNQYYRYLVSPKGVEGPYIQREGPVFNKRYWVAQACFSPDGNIFLRSREDHGVYIYDFDRCSGLLHYKELIPFQRDTAAVMGVSVAPNSRYAYISTWAGVWQFDLKADKVASTKTLIGETNNDEGRLLHHLCGPDGKIYIMSYTSTRNISIIHQPNLKAPACLYERNGLILPNIHSNAGFNQPHFRLYAAEGSPCDTIGRPAWGADLVVTPNPGSDQINVQIPEYAGICWQVFTAAGQLVGSYTSDIYRLIELDTHNWPCGVYIISGCGGEGRRFRKRFMVMR